MANIQNKVIQIYNNVQIVDEVYYQFSAMANKFAEDFKDRSPALNLSIDQSFVSKYKVADQLRKRLINPQNYTDYQDVLLPPELTTVDQFNKLIDLLEATNTPPNTFSPPIPTAQPSLLNNSRLIYPPENYPNLDPRTTGRLVILAPYKPDSFLVNSDVRNWLLNNSLLWGFLLYDNIGLYYEGLQKIKEQITNAEQIVYGTGILNTVQKYQSTPIPQSIITTSSDQVLSANAVPPPSSASNQGIQVGECTEVQRNGVKKLIHTGLEPQFANKRRTPRSITLHITAGWGDNAQRTVDYVGRCDGSKTSQTGIVTPAPSWWRFSGIHYAVDRKGVVAAGIPEDIECIHGNNWNAYGIGVEIGNFGALVQVNGEWRTKSYNNPITHPRIQGQPVDLGFLWEGERYFLEYTDVQIAALEQLLNQIMARWPDIRQGVTGQNLWRTVFGVPGGKPSPNQQVVPLGGGQLKQAGILPDGYASYGMFAHITGTDSGSDRHTDAIPTPKLVSMLKRLGYTE